MIQYCTALDKNPSPGHVLLQPHNHHLNSLVQKLLCAHVWQETEESSPNSALFIATSFMAHVNIRFLTYFITLII